MRTTQTLNGTWTLHNNDKTILIDAGVPGQVHDALLKSGYLKEDPYFGLNYVDEKFLALIHDKWTYTRTFTLETGGSNTNTKVFLDCHGLDTIATIDINGQTATKTNNQFRRYVVDISSLINPGENTIAISFDDATAYALEASEAYPYYVPDMFNISDAQHGFPCRNFVRKEQCSFSWDWGPAFAPCGIWRPIELHVVDSFQVLQWHWNVAMSEESRDVWELQITADCYSVDVTEVDCFITLESLDKSTSIPLNFDSKHHMSNEYCTLILSAKVPADKVSLWWPRGLGNQSLYQVTVQIFKAQGSAGGPKMLFNDVFRCGFRTCRLVQDSVDHPLASGTGFWFEVNGVSLFAKGTNWIPAHAFDKLGSWKKKRLLLESCMVANMNMIRIWGGGVYEDDVFYDYCDRHGIMIWQEFMFACALYPTDAEFLGNVRQEVEYQVKRLGGHPSLILWSGNNENQEFMVKGWDKATVENPYIFSIDYHKLYIETIRDAVLKLDRTRSFISSSPSAGIVSESPYTERYVLKDAERGLYGDVHFYDYKHDGRHAENFPNTRFASGKWKMLHHFVKRAFQDILVSTVELPGRQGLEVHVSNNKQVEAGGVLTIRSHRIDGVELKLAQPSEIPFHVGAQSSTCVLTLPDCVLRSTEGGGDGDADSSYWQLVSIGAYVTNDLRDKHSDDGSQTRREQLPRTFHLYPTREPFPIEQLSSETSIIIEDVRLQPSGWSHNENSSSTSHKREYDKDDEDRDKEEEGFVVEFTIQSTAVAGYVWLEWTRPFVGGSNGVADEETPSFGYFDDNGFWLLPLYKKVVRYHGRGRCTSPPKISDISIKSLFDALQSFDFV
ncbi:hypothetical protein DFQ27_004037 [Actinomortierella ambigua]|uniref:beta-mannosidase n=1 Tax=Actinomortierella ambigua TaxID=1343610 RepID=A0A9P6Q665_9FUNG|nr:hypothetical protein DFQ27_004037 [Actinomortierella ambigua]